MMRKAILFLFLLTAMFSCGESQPDSQVESAVKMPDDAPSWAEKSRTDSVYIPFLNGDAIRTSRSGYDSYLWDQDRRNVSYNKWIKSQLDVINARLGITPPPVPSLNPTNEGK